MSTRWPAHVKSTAVTAENLAGAGTLAAVNEAPRRIHLGSWVTAPETWINIDASWSARLAKRPRLRRLVKASRLAPASLFETEWPPNILVHDLRKPLPFPDGFASAVYGSHVLEHLYFTEAKRLLAECFRVLEPRGVLRLVVPDLRAIVREYLGERAFADGVATGSSPADRMNERLLLRPPEPPRGSFLYRLYSAATEFHWHKWMYDADSLAAHLRAAGFEDVREMPYNESRIDGIAEVERRERVVDECGVCVEGVRR